MVGIMVSKFIVLQEMQSDAMKQASGGWGLVVVLVLEIKIPITHPWDWYIYSTQIYHKNQANVGKYIIHGMVWDW